MLKDLIGTLKNSPRRLLRTHTNFLAAIFSGLPIAMFFALVWLGPLYNNWEHSIIKWFIYLLFTCITSYTFYRFGIFLSRDQDEKKNFHDNFFIGSFAAILISLAIIFHLFIKENLLVTPIIVTIIPILYFILNYSLFKLKKPK